MLHIFEKGLLLLVVGAAVMLNAEIWVIALAISLRACLGWSLGLTICQATVPLLYRCVYIFENTSHQDSRLLSYGRAQCRPAALTRLLSASCRSQQPGFGLGDRIVGASLIIPVVASTANIHYWRAACGLERVPKIAAAMMIVGLAAAIAGAFMCPYVVPAVFGDGYEEAVPVVQLMFS